MMFHERELFHEQQVKAAPYLISLNVASDGTTGYGFSKQNCVAFSENYRISKKDPEEDPLLGAFYERVFVIAPGHMDKVIAMLEKEL